MSKWENALVTVENNKAIATDGPIDPKGKLGIWFIEFLNIIGKDGWQQCGMVMWPDKVIWIAVKREVE